MQCRRLEVTILALVVALLVPGVAHAELPSLDRVVELARERAVGVADAQGELGVARAQMEGAQVSSFGNPFTDVQVDRGVGDSSSVQVLSYTYFPVDVAGQRGKRIAEADKLVRWRSLGVDDARALAAGEAVAAYGEILVGLSRVAEAGKGEATARDEATYFRGRLEAKDTTVYEQAVAEAEITRWVQAGAEAQLRVTSARARLAWLTGVTTMDLPPQPPDPSPPDFRHPWNPAHIGEAVTRSPTLMKLRAEQAYWEASLERYERERVPPVSLELIAGRGGFGELRLGGGAVVTFPVARRYEGEIARAERGREHAMATTALHRNVVEARIRAASDALDTVRKTLEEVDKNGLPALQRAVVASVESFRAGKIDLTRALLARRELATARARRLDMLEAGWRAYAELVAASGGLP